MTDGTQSSRPDRKRRLAPVLALGGRFLVISVSLLLMVGGAVSGYLLGRNMAMRPLATATELLDRLQPESQRLKTTVFGQNATIATLQSKLSTAEKALNEVVPAQDTYRISANRALIVADGHLTVGLVGPPANATVTLNINGKQYTLVSGDTIHLTPDPATTCDVRIQSFDMFLATVHAICARVKPR